MSTCGSFSSVEHWQTHTHTYTHPIALLPQSLQEWQVIQKFIFMAGNGNGTTKRGVSCCATTSYWGALEGREWHLTAWRWGASDQLAADALVHIETVQMVFKVRRCKLRGMVPRAEGVISCSHHLAAVKGDKQENQYSHSGQFTTRASLSRPVCQNQSLKWSGMWTADKVGVRAHWSHSYSATEVLFSTVDSSRKTATNPSKLVPSLSTLCHINIIVIAWH